MKISKDHLSPKHHQQNPTIVRPTMQLLVLRGWLWVFPSHQRKFCWETSDGRRLNINTKEKRVKMGKVGKTKGRKRTERSEKKRTFKIQDHIFRARHGIWWLWSVILRGRCIILQPWKLHFGGNLEWNARLRCRRHEYSSSIPEVIEWNTSADWLGFSSNFDTTGFDDKGPQFH